MNKYYDEVNKNKIEEMNKEFFKNKFKVVIDEECSKNTDMQDFIEGEKYLHQESS